MINSDERAWAASEFGRAELGNRLRLVRLMAMAAQVATKPGGTVTSVFATSAEREGAFRFLENDHVDPTAMARGAHLAAASRCAGESYAYAPVDQTSLNLTDGTGRKGFGAVGRSRDRAKGLQVMTAIAVSPEGTPQGLTGQAYWSRPRGKKKKRPQDRDKQHTKDKETERWLCVMRQTRAAFAEAAPLTKPWFQLDRGGDAWPILTEFGTGDDVWLTVRASWDRRLWTAPGEPQRYLWETVEREEPLGDFLLFVPERPGRTARFARMELRACLVPLDLRDKRTGRHHRLNMWAVQAREVGTTPGKERPLEWMLLTNRPVDDVQSAQEVVFGYSQRWRIEDFHRTWKTGACRVEESQLRDVDNLIRWAILLSSVAMRIQRLMYLSRSQPEQPATVEFTQPEIDAVIVATRQKRYQRGDVPPVVEVVRWIAEEGGYTGKSSGGPPGATVLARGLERLQVLFRVFTDEAATGERKR